MGVGRRDFLKIFSSAMTLASTSSAVVLSEDKHTYINRRLGFSCRIPEGWIVQTMKDMGQVKEGQVLATEDTEMKDIFYETMGAPFVGFTVPREGMQFGPGFNVFLSEYGEVEKELDRDPGTYTMLDGSPSQPLHQLRKKPVEYARADIEGLELLLGEIETLSEPKPCSISKCDAAEYILKFHWQHKEIKDAIPVRLRSFYIFQDPFGYLVRLYDSPYYGSDNVFDYDDFVKSIVLV